MNRYRLLSGTLARVCGLALAALVSTSALTARAEIKTTVTATEQDGFARVIFRFDRMPQIETRVTNGIVVLRFDDVINANVDRLDREIGSFVSIARRDPDGKGIRLALSRRVTVNPMKVGERLFVDLLPDNWVGAPPALPPDVLEELTAQAREGERLKAEEEARRKRTKTTPITVRAATLPNFSRLTFMLEEPAPVSLVREGSKVKVSFDAALTADVTAIKAELPERLEGIDSESKDARLTLTLDVPEKMEIRAFWDGSNYTLDLSGGDGAARINPASGLETILKKAAATEGATTLAATAPPPREPAPPPEEAAAVQPGQGAEPAKSAEAPAPASIPAETDATPQAPLVIEAAAPKLDLANRPDAEGSGAVKPLVQVVGKTVRLAFGFNRRTPTAMFRRGQTLFLVFETRTPIDTRSIVKEAGYAISDASATALDSAILVRLKLASRPLATVAADGTSWIVSIGENILEGAEPVALQRVSSPEGRTTLTANLEGIGSVHQIDDPVVGDTLDVVTLSGPPRAFLKPLDFVEVRGLVSVQGLVFLRKADDVTISSTIDTLTIAREAGLTLSSVREKPKERAPGEKRTALIDVAQWAKEQEQPFRERERELFDHIVNASPKDAGSARLALARFYTAKGYAAEASAILREAEDKDANINRLPEFGLLSAIAAIDLGRGEEATKILADSGLAASADGSLWRSLAEAAKHNWPTVREAFVKGSDVLELYAPRERLRFRRAAYEAAIEAGDIAEAQSHKKSIEALGLADVGDGHIALLNARLDELTGRNAEALEGYRAVMEGDDAISAAEARLRAAPLRRIMGQADDKAVLDELETLAAIWRGDETEAKTLLALGEEYQRAGRYRDAFTQMQVALENYPASASTRMLQDKLSKSFIELFLEGKADKLPPLEALSLFYDFRNLTPFDRRGDEMIRKLADRLIGVDLLDQAADLLTHQVEKRLSGAARSQVAAKLALVNLMNRKPAQALKALNSTRQQDLPQALREARLILEARALSETARPDLALEILDSIKGDEGRQLRADVLWQARRWQPAGEAIEAMLGDVWSSSRPLPDADRTQVMRAAIAYSLAEDKIGLDRLRTKFAEKMAGSPDAAAFETVTAPINARGSAFRDIAKSIAQSDTLGSFVKEYRERYERLATPVEPENPSPKPEAAVAMRPGAG